MKPPKLNKFSKKQLRKFYTQQWKANNSLAGENANLKILNSCNKRQIEILENALKSAEEALEFENLEIEHKDRLLKSLINS